MTCEESRNAIDDYLAGRLAPDAKRAIEVHLSACPECREDLDAARMVAPHLANLPTSLLPERELWSGIERRIRPGIRRQPMLIAAAILLVLVPAALLVRSRQESPPPPMPAAVAPAVAPLVATYESAARELELSVESLARATPALGTSVTRQLAILDAAIAESAGALEAEPANETLQVLLLSAHRKKLALLRQVAELGAEG
ncbi:MAG: anti-sigma factor family protein [Anaerolineales bacterium]